MRTVFRAVIAVVVCLTATLASAQQQITVYGTIVDASGAPAAVVEAADVRVTENGAELKVLKVEAFTLPTKLQVLLDNGAGLGAENLVHLRNGLKGLIEALPEGVETSILTIAPQARFLVRPTKDKAAMLKAVELVAPDGGVGRFVESINEALQRNEKDTSEFSPALIVVGSSAGDSNTMERDLERIQKRVQAKTPTVHVAIISSPGRTASQGAMQAELGIWLTQVTGGRYDSLAAPSRLATLLPELGAKVAASHQKQGKQFRVTAQRASASAPLGGISMGVAAGGGLRVTGVSLDGRHP